MAVIQGPRFSTRAESAMLRQLGAEFINMSAAPEAFLARELGLCYVPISLVTDADTAAIAEEVSMKQIQDAIRKNWRNVPLAIAAIVEAARLGELRTPKCSCRATDIGLVDADSLDPEDFDIQPEYPESTHRVPRQ